MIVEPSYAPPLAAVPSPAADQRTASHLGSADKRTGSARDAAESQTDEQDWGNMMPLRVALVLTLAIVSAASAVPGDLNRDGVVDFDDFYIFADNFGKTGPPEPPDTVVVRTTDTLVVTERDTVVVTRTDTLVQILRDTVPDLTVHTDGLYWSLVPNLQKKVLWLKFRDDGTYLLHPTEYLNPQRVDSLLTSMDPVVVGTWSLNSATGWISHRYQGFGLAGHVREDGSLFFQTTFVTILSGSCLPLSFHYLKPGAVSKLVTLLQQGSTDVVHDTIRITVFDTVFVSLDDRLRTEGHERSGYGWTTSWGWVGTTAR